MIEVIGLRAHRGGREVLRGIDLGFHRGEVSVIIGPSGGGKSTLLRCLIGLEPFDAGAVVIDGHRLDGGAAPGAGRRGSLVAIRRKVGMVFQGFHLFPHRTVLQNVTEAPIHVLRQGAEEARMRALALLDRVGMADFADRRPATLSGGQQQRVAIARALAMGPEAILFDEPTSALDPRMTAEVLAVMADLARDGQSMVVVTHAMEFARRAAGAVHVVADGLVVESGPPGRVLDDPGQEATRAFLGKTLAA